MSADPVGAIVSACERDEPWGREGEIQGPTDMYLSHATVAGFSAERAHRSTVAPLQGREQMSRVRRRAVSYGGSVAIHRRRLEGAVSQCSPSPLRSPFPCIPSSIVVVAVRPSYEKRRRSGQQHSWLSQPCQRPRPRTSLSSIHCLSHRGCCLYAPGLKTCEHRY